MFGTGSVDELWALWSPRGGVGWRMQRARLLRIDYLPVNGAFARKNGRTDWEHKRSSTGPVGRLWGWYPWFIFAVMPTMLVHDFRKAESLVFHGPYTSVSEYQLSTDLSPFLLVATVLRETAPSLGILSQRWSFHVFEPAHWQGQKDGGGLISDRLIVKETPIIIIIGMHILHTFAGIFDLRNFEHWHVLLTIDLRACLVWDEFANSMD